MKKQGKAIVLSVTLLSIITYWLWPMEQVSPSEGVDTTSKVPSSTLDEPQSGHDKRVRPNLDLDTNNYALCNQFLSDFYEHNKDWGRRHYESWKTYIEEELYSLNDVTLAVEYFLNSNFAESFRLEYLRTTAPLTQKNKSLSSELLEMFPSMSDLGFNVRIIVPNPTLKSFGSATLEEKQRIISENKVTVDDVAYFLLDLSVSEPDILLLIKALEDSHTTVSYDRHGAITLLDYAILSSRPLIVETLLKNGHQLTTDEYLGSSMEWALHALQHGYYSDKRENAVRVIEQLMALGAPARFRSKTEKLVEGSFPRRFYKFDAEQVSALTTDFNLELTEIPARESIKIDEHHPLILELKEQQRRDYARNENILNADQTVSQCLYTKQRVKDAWKAESAYDVITKLSNQHSKDEESLRAELAHLDPYLVDFYNRHVVQPTVKKNVNKDLMDRLDLAYELHSEGKTDEAIELALSVSIHESQRQWLMLKLLSFGNSIHSAVFSSPLYNELNDYSILDNWRLLSKSSIESMLDAGAPIDDIDRYGKTLVFYAAHNRDVQLLDYLFEKQVRFHSKMLGQDPLHVALKINGNVSDLRNLEEMIDILMRFKPSIDVYHLRRMKLISLYYPAIYERVVEEHSELTATDDIGLPSIYFF